MSVASTGCDLYNIIYKCLKGKKEKIIFNQGIQLTGYKLIESEHRSTDSRFSIYFRPDKEGNNQMGIFFIGEPVDTNQRELLEDKLKPGYVMVEIPLDTIPALAEQYRLYQLAQVINNGTASDPYERLKNKGRPKRQKLE